MATQSPEQVAQQWASRLGASTDRIKAGIAAVTVSPGVQAAKAADTWANNTVNAKDKYKRNVGNLSLQAWQDAASNKGVQRIAQGAQASVGKMTNFMTQFLPYVDTARQSLPARGTFDQNINRAVQMATALHSFKYNKQS